MGREKERDALARDIDDNAQSTIRSSFGDEFRGDKLGNRLGEVDAVDENVDIKDFGEWTALGRFGHVPLDDVFPNYQQGVSEDDKVFFHEKTYSATPAFLKRSTAPDPHRPKAPMINTFTPFLPFSVLSNAWLTSLTISPSLG